MTPDSGGGVAQRAADDAWLFILLWLVSCRRMLEQALCVCDDVLWHAQTRTHEQEARFIWIVRPQTLIAQCAMCIALATRADAIDC